MSKGYLGEFEELVLLMIAKYEDQAYGLLICDEIAKHTDRTATIGAVHATTVRLEKKGYIETTLGGATAERGGRRKRLIRITALGKQVLVNSRDMKLRLWQQIPALNPTTSS